MFPLVYFVFALFVGTDAIRVPLIQRRSDLSKRSTSISVSKQSNALPHNALLSTTQNAAAQDDSGLTLDSVHDLIYMAQITLAGVEYTAQLDTGSSDLWIKGASYPIPHAIESDVTQNLTYGIGWAYGTIAHAPVTFANISIKSQGFLDVSSAQNPVLSYGGNGILGLGFTSLSHVDFALNKTDNNTGRSLLYNMFQENPSEPNFIAFSLQRSTEAGDEVQGSFSIGELEPEYASVMNTTGIPTWPVASPKRWNVLLDAVLIGNNKTVVPTTTVPDAPSNKAVVLLDSGTSYTYAPTEICDAIYGDIPGAKYQASLGQWSVPCSYEIDMALQINGVIYPIHPLDVSPVSLIDSTQCVGSFVPQSISVGAGQFDWLVGDNVLRSVYSIYDFGDFDASGAMGNPYVKLLPLIDPNEAAIDFTNVRGGTPNQNITFSTANAGAAGSDSTSVTLSTDVAQTLDKIGKYFPAMLGVMALNALVLIALIIFGIIYACRRRGGSVRRNTTRLTRGRLSPMPGIPLSNRNSYVGVGAAPQPHTYEPVSMALTEDTLFAAPSPAFHSFDGSTSRPGDRPKSMA